jgi:hypothetical protein
MTGQTPAFMTTPEVAALFAEHGIKASPRTVQRLAESGKLRYLRKTRGTDYAFDRSEVLLYIVEQKKAVA